MSEREGNLFSVVAFFLLEAVRGKKKTENAKNKTKEVGSGQWL